MNLSIFFVLKKSICSHLLSQLQLSIVFSTLIFSQPISLLLPQPMSNYLIRSPKSCSSKQLNHGKLFKKLILCISVIVSIVMIIVLVLYTLHPSKPKFSIQEADIYKMNLSSNHLLSSVMQVTVVAKNPNQRVGIYYDNLDAYVVYKGQQITVHSSFRPFYQGHDDVNVLSSWMSGNSIPVSPSFSEDMSIDQSAGKLQMNVKLTGRVRWKVCSWASGHHSLEVDCHAFLAYNPNNVFDRYASLIPGSECHTTV